MARRGAHLSCRRGGDDAGDYPGQIASSAQDSPQANNAIWVFMIEKLWIFVLLMSRTLFFSLVFRSLNEASLLEGTLHVVEIDSYLLRPELVLLF